MNNWIHFRSRPTSRRKKAPDVAVVPATDLPGRVLLGLLTALIVARPHVLGEDPGLLHRPWSDATSLVLSLVWLITALGWALHRAWSGQTRPTVAILEGGLALLAGIGFWTAEMARYQHPAWLIAWEGVIVFLAFTLTRRLAVTADDNRALLAALLATGVSVAAYAIYQDVVVMPRTRALADDPGRLRTYLAENEAQHLADDDPLLDQFAERMRARNVYATYAHPNSFAGFLALLVPAIIGWTVVSWRRTGIGVRTVAIAVMAGIVLAALFLTHSRGAILGTLVACGVLLIFRGRAFLWRHRFSLAVVLVLLACGITALFVSQAGRTALDDGWQKAVASQQLRRDYWVATWRMLTDPEAPGRIWVGVGPGNFGRLYPRYIQPAAWERIKDPHNFILDVWASSGVFAVVVLVGVLVAFFWRTRTTWTATDADRASLPEPSGKPCWEYYLGGIGGLVLAFGLRTAHLQGDELLTEGLIAGVLASLWFAVFAVLISVPWPGPSRGAALTAGVLALLLNLCVSGGIGFPSVAQPLWIMAALAVNAVVEQVWLPTTNWYARIAPLPIAGALLVGYAAAIFFPVVNANSEYTQARGYAQRYHDLRKQLEQVPKDLTPVMMQAQVEPIAKQFMVLLSRAPGAPSIIRHLEEAVKYDPTDVALQVELLNWYREAWELAPKARYEDRIDQLLTRSTTLDPLGVEPHLFNFGFQLRAIQRLQELAAKEGVEDAHKKQIEAQRTQRQVLALAALKVVIERDPREEARLRFQYGEMLKASGDKSAADLQLKTALEVDTGFASPLGRLTPAQRDEARAVLGTP